MSDPGIPLNNTEPVKVVRKSRKKLMKPEMLMQRDRWIGILTIICLLVLWEIEARLQLFDARFLPAPSSVIVEGWKDVRSGLLLWAVLISLKRMMIGYSLGAATGLLLGVIMGVNRLIRAIVKPIISILFPLPRIALLPLILIIFGFGDMSIFVLVFLAVVFTQIIISAGAVMDIDPAFHEVGKIYGFSRFDHFRWVLIPGALPIILAGLRDSLGHAFLATLIAEFLTAREGLGYLIWHSWEIFNVQLTFLSLIVTGILGFVLFRFIDFAEKFFVPWKDE